MIMAVKSLVSRMEAGLFAFAAKSIFWLERLPGR